MTERVASSRDPLIGSLIDGRYLVQNMLARGGMGVVYAAIHEELQRPAAIKVLNPAWAADPEGVTRFLREARVASSLSHPNIVAVWDLGRLPDGRPYLVMPRIAGADLASLLLEEGPQHPHRVASLLAGVASALDMIHSRGFVHRDIKPENLLYVPCEDGTETVMVLDFGIAAAVLSESRLTQSGMLCGTPDFLPPEAVTGALPDRRGDVYALTTVAFELITGTLPFHGADPFQLLPMKLAQPAPSMSSASGRPFPDALEQVIARGLAVRPEDRYASAGEFVRALAAVADTVAVRAGMRMRGAAAQRAGSNTRKSTIRRTAASAATNGHAAHTTVPARGQLVSRTPNAVQAPGLANEDLDAALPWRRRRRRYGKALSLLGAALVCLGLLWIGKARAPQTAPAVAPAPEKTVERQRVEPQAPEQVPEAVPAPVPQPQPQPQMASPAVLPNAVEAPEEPRVQTPSRRSRARRAAAMSRKREARASELEFPPAAPPEPVPPWEDQESESVSKAEAPAPVFSVGPATPAAPEPVAAQPTPPAPPVTPATPAMPAPEPAKSAEAPAPKDESPTSAAKATAPEPGPVPAQPSDRERARELNERATSAMLQGQLGSALALFQRASEADSDYAAAWRGRGIVLQQLGRPREAVHSFRQFLRLEPRGAQSSAIRERLAAIERANSL